MLKKAIRASPPLGWGVILNSYQNSYFGKPPLVAEH
jgi:hypothetical protein